MAAAWRRIELDFRPRGRPIRPPRLLHLFLGTCLVALAAGVLQPGGRALLPGIAAAAPRRILPAVTTGTPPAATLPQNLSSVIRQTPGGSVCRSRFLSEPPEGIGCPATPQAPLGGDWTDLIAGERMSFKANTDGVVRFSLVPNTDAAGLIADDGGPGARGSLENMDPFRHQWESRD